MRARALRRCMEDYVCAPRYCDPCLPYRYWDPYYYYRPVFLKSLFTFNLYRVSAILTRVTVRSCRHANLIELCPSVEVWRSTATHPHWELKEGHIIKRTQKLRCNNKRREKVWMIAVDKREKRKSIGFAGCKRILSTSRGDVERRTWCAQRWMVPQWLRPKSLTLTKGARGQSRHMIYLDKLKIMGLIRVAARRDRVNKMRARGQSWIRLSHTIMRRLNWVEDWRV